MVAVIFVFIGARRLLILAWVLPGLFFVVVWGFFSPLERAEERKGA